MKIFTITTFYIIISICLNATATLTVCNLNHDGIPLDHATITRHIAHQRIYQKDKPTFLTNLTPADIRDKTWCLVYVNGNILQITHRTHTKTALFRSGWIPSKGAPKRGYRLAEYTVVMFDWQNPPSSTPYQHIIPKTKNAWLAELRSLGYQVPRGLQAEIRKRLGDTEEVVTAYLLIRNILRRAEHDITRRGKADVKAQPENTIIDIIGSRDSCYSCIWLFLELIRIYQGRLTLRYSSTKRYTNTSRRMKDVCCRRHPSVRAADDAVQSMPRGNRYPLLFIYSYQ